MLARIVVLLCAFSLVAHCGAGEDTRSRELLDSRMEAAETPPPPSQVGTVDPSPPRFEAYRKFSVEDYLAALAELVESRPAPEDPAAQTSWERDMTYRVGVLLEYYPLAARTPAHGDALLELAGQYRSPVFLRVFLMRQAAPGLAPRSVLSTWLQGHVAQDSGTYLSRLKEIIQLPQESVPVQRAAMEALLAHTVHAYATLLARDPAAQSGDVLHARQLIGQPDAIPLSRQTQGLLERLNGETGRWARSLQALTANTRRDTTLRARAGEVLDALLRDYPIDGRDELLAVP